MGKDSQKPLPKPPSVVGGRPTVSTPWPRITDPLDYDFPDFPPGSIDQVKIEANLAAHAFNIEAKVAPSRRELRSLRIGCVTRVGRVYCREANQLRWGASRIDSHVREFFDAALIWVGLATDRGDVRPEDQPEVDDALSAVLREALEAVPEYLKLDPAGEAAPKADEAALAQPETATTGNSYGADPVAAERKALLAAFKARARGQRIKVTDAMVAKAANDLWNDRSMVTWWKRNDPRCKQPHDKKIRAVLGRDPSSVWPPG